MISAIPKKSPKSYQARLSNGKSRKAEVERTANDCEKLNGNKSINCPTPRRNTPDSVKKREFKKNRATDKRMEK